MPEVSIIVRTKNEAKYVAQALDAVFSQRFVDFEVIVVDSGSSDGTLEIVDRYNARLLQMRPEDFTYGHALNQGARAAQGKYLVFLSAHAIPYDDLWLSHLVEWFGDPMVAAVSSRHLPLPAGKLYFSRRLLQALHARLPVSRLVLLFLFHNASSAIRRAVWEVVPFCESIIAHEDHDWAKKVTDLGYTIGHEPRSVALHSHDEGVSDWLRRTCTGVRVIAKIHFGVREP